MPRCQRTFRRFSSAHAAAPDSSGSARWTCPYCPDAETYETVEASDLREYADLAFNACLRDFGSPPDSRRPFLLLRGLRPECVLEPDDRRYDIYLQSGSDPYQMRLQIGHEMFHRVAASNGLIFHWTHEMLACLVSVRLLRDCGYADYAKQMERQYLNDAAQMTFAQMTRADPWAEAAYPAGFYARAYAIGLDLLEITGWKSLCRLARCLSPARRPDLEAWLARLSPSTAHAARRALLVEENDAGQQAGGKRGYNEAET